MVDYLVLALVAPMGAFGDLAGHERRGSHHWPGRSALLGVIGAALGVRREDRKGQAVLASWRTAVSVLQASEIWRDFHTVQTVPSARIKRPETRRAALEALQRTDTGIITRREYRSDCAFGVALWGGEIRALEEALKRPAFTPYLGRKSCPLSAPMDPKAVKADNPAEALARITLPPFLDLDPARPLLIASDEELGEGWIETRWDDPLDREAWHFGQRVVHVCKPERDA
ncbi:MAG: type I-E CRISPR-associated protein Cas5/CasD [Boseongicola sp.]|nr:type I-E CRISPR-associated protein Cas5/CasD [Boseongicola sp.]